MAKTVHGAAGIDRCEVHDVSKQSYQGYGVLAQDKSNTLRWLWDKTHNLKFEHETLTGQGHGY
jgi:hypothetical protein